MNEHDFDKQINDSFGGIGKQRTVLSGTWKTYVENAIDYLGYAWFVAACWQEGDRIVTTLADNLNTEWMVSVNVACVSQHKALETIAVAAYEQDYPRKRIAKHGSDPTPENAVQGRLWYELWQDGREHEYEGLGGTWEGDNE